MGGNPLWRSDSLRIYTSHCKKTKTENEIKGCLLKDYDFGEELREKYNISNVDASSQSECSKKCDQDESCTFSSWKEKDKDCRLLNGLKEIAESNTKTGEFLNHFLYS